MNLKSALVALVLFAAASGLELSEYRIVATASGTTVNQVVTLRFSEPVGTITYEFDTPFENLEAMDDTGPLDVRVEGNNATITVNGAVLYLNFYTQGLVSKNDRDYLYFATTEMPLNVNKFRYSLTLPSGATLSQRPDAKSAGALTTTDGQRMTVTLEREGVAGGTQIAFNVYYKTESNSAIYFVGLVLFLFYLYHIRNRRNAVLAVLSEDERKVVELLTPRKREWQNVIRRELQFGRAKTTRVIKRLEAKRLVRREGHGKKNRIVLRKI